MLSRAISEENATPIVLPKASPLLFVISGPSGVGKDTLVDELKKRDPTRRYAITATTRPRRPGEVDEVHYHFRSPEQFQELIDAGELLEWAEVYGNRYGVPKFELRESLTQNLDVVVKVDVQGAATIKKLIPQAILIFVAPYSMSELLQRHFRRRTEAGQELNLRLQTAKQEMEAMPIFDYVVVNKQGEMVRGVTALEAIIAAEKSRMHPRVYTL